MRPLRERARIRRNHAHAWFYARSGGRVGRSVGGHPVLLLTTTGRRSGHPRRTPVQFERIDGRLLLVASNAGAPRSPDWWHNVQATAEVTVQIGRERHPAYALTLDEDHRAEVWPKLCERNPGLEPLERRAGRTLPVVELLPVPGHEPLD